MSEGRAIRSIAVAGGGIVGLSAATAFARALPRCSVTVIETDADSASLADILPVAHPGALRFHDAIGIDEAELVRDGIAAHHLGTIFHDWSAGGEAWVHAFGDYGKPVGAIPFDQLWVAARRAGQARAYDRYSVGAALARADKFVHPASDPDFIGSRFDYGLRVDPDRYRGRLRVQAERSNVDFIAAIVAGIERGSDGGISRLQLSDGRTVEADLFVDCTGPAAKLIGALDTDFEDWGAWMPFGRARFEWSTGEDVPRTADRITARDDGWSILWTLPGRTLTAQLNRDSGEIAIAPGRRLRPWVGNVLALGDAAVALDPLHGFHLELAQAAILLALELLPGPDFPVVETAEYNRRAALLTAGVRDFVALHYLRSGRSEGAWADLDAPAPPDSLAHMLDQFSHRGRIPFREDDPISRDRWTAALIGLGVVPRNVDPAAAAVRTGQIVPAMDLLAGEIDAVVSGLPDYREYLRRFG